MSCFHNKSDDDEIRSALQKEFDEIIKMSEGTLDRLPPICGFKPKKSQRSKNKKLKPRCRNESDQLIKGTENTLSTLRPIPGLKVLDQEDKASLGVIESPIGAPPSDAYFRYISSETFNADTSFDSVRKLRDYAAISRSTEVKKIWNTYRDDVALYLDKKAHGILGKIKRYAIDNKLLDVCFETLSEGRRHESNRSDQLVTQLSDLWKTQNFNLNVLMSEMKTRRAQAGQLADQVLNASSAINSAVLGIESILLLDRETMNSPPTPKGNLPPPIISSHPKTRTPVTTDKESSFDEQHLTHSKNRKGRPVERMEKDGSYQCEFFDLTILDEKVSEFNVKDSAFGLFTILKKKNAKIAKAFFNRDLNTLKSLCLTNPSWLSNYHDNPSLETQVAAINAMRTLPSSQFQFLFIPRTN